MAAAHSFAAFMDRTLQPGPLKNGKGVVNVRRLDQIHAHLLVPLAELHTEYLRYYEAAPRSVESEADAWAWCCTNQADDPAVGKGVR